MRWTEAPDAVGLIQKSLESKPVTHNKQSGDALNVPTDDTRSQFLDVLATHVPVNALIESSDVLGIGKASGSIEWVNVLLD